METIAEYPVTKSWCKMWIVKISTVGTDGGKEFSKWLYGQTVPLVTDDENPTDWAYYHDYCRFINKQPIID